MASPFARKAPDDTAHTRVIRSGIELTDYTAQRPDGKMSVFERTFAPSRYRSFQTRSLPKKGEENILITSALPYVNNQPHLGQFPSF